MSFNSLQRIYFFILLTLLLGKGDGQWKKSSKDVLQRDIKIYKKMSDKIRQEIEDFYTDYSQEPINDYFLEEIDYVESKIKKYFGPKIKSKGSKEVIMLANHTTDNNKIKPLDENYSNSLTSIRPINNTQKLTSNTTHTMWPKFEEMLSAIGKQYDWKNDRWIKVKAKMKDKEKTSLQNLKYKFDHLKHNFKYRIVKLNRAKSKRKVVIAVTAVR